jgi:hypothetical protein
MFTQTSFSSGVSSPSYQAKAPRFKQSETTPPAPQPVDPALQTAVKNRAMNNELKLQMLIGYRLDQLGQNPTALSLLPAGELRMIAGAIGNHPHHGEGSPPPLPPKFTAIG